MSEKIETYFTPETFEDARGHVLPYRLRRPDRKPNGKVPLVVHMHGLRGIGTDNLAHISGPTPKATERIRGTLICVHATNQERFPCFVVAPQSDGDGWVTFTEEPTSSILAVIDLICSLRSRFPIDSQRCYVLGHSMGAHGAWELITRSPNVFAAAVPIGGWGRVELAHLLVDRAIWAFSVAGDPVIKAKHTHAMVAAIREAGGAPIHTEYPSDQHGLLLQAYKEPELLPWLFSQKLP